MKKHLFLFAVTLLAAMACTNDPKLEATLIKPETTLIKPETTINDSVKNPVEVTFMVPDPSQLVKGQGNEVVYQQPNSASNILQYDEEACENFEYFWSTERDDVPMERRRNANVSFGCVIGKSGSYSKLQLLDKKGYVPTSSLSSVHLEDMSFFRLLGDDDAVYPNFTIIKSGKFAGMVFSEESCEGCYEYRMGCISENMCVMNYELYGLSDLEKNLLVSSENEYYDRLKDISSLSEKNLETLIKHFVKTGISKDSRLYAFTSDGFLRCVLPIEACHSLKKTYPFVDNREKFYGDGSLFDARGFVKSIKGCLPTEFGDSIIYFNRQQRVIWDYSKDENGDIHGWLRDKDGRIHNDCTYPSDSSTESYDGIGPLSYSYSTDGRLESFMNEASNITIDYMHLDGNLVETEILWFGNSSRTSYSGYVFDKHGNWTERMLKYSDGRCLKEQREITYYEEDDTTALLPIFEDIINWTFKDVPPYWMYQLYKEDISVSGSKSKKEMTWYGQNVSVIMNSKGMPKFHSSEGAHSMLFVKVNEAGKCSATVYLKDKNDWETLRTEANICKAYYKDLPSFCFNSDKKTGWYIIKLK